MLTTPQKQQLVKVLQYATIGIIVLYFGLTVTKLLPDTFRIGFIAVLGPLLIFRYYLEYQLNGEKSRLIMIIFIIGVAAYFTMKQYGLL